MKNGDIEGDWVTIGVLVDKMPQKTTSTGKNFSGILNCFYKKCLYNNCNNYSNTPNLIISLFIINMHKEQKICSFL